MKIEFYSEEFLQYYISTYSGKPKYPESVIIRYRDKINFMKEAVSINELSRIRSFNIEKYKGHWSARINKQFRIEFDFIKPDTIIILKISKHYEN